jgi:wyosine [tRNA(Phe)-imidazoG37] synthetase (radical SAM superfamily)
MADSREWTSQYNPFNSAKLFAHRDRWKHIRKGGVVPAPALVTVDPINACNYNCKHWCNAEYVLGKDHGRIQNEALNEIADFLPYWGIRGGEAGVESFHGAAEKVGIASSMVDDLYGVRAVCIAGGGEPLMHPYVGKFITRLADNGVKSGVVTNGR